MKYPIFLGTWFLGSSKNLDSGLAVLETKQKIPLGLSLGVEAAMLPENTDSLVGRDITVGGWGWISWPRGSTNLANYQVINTTVTTTCEGYGSSHKPGVFCAGTNNQTPCYGDLGAGAIVPGQPPRVVGMLVGRGCDKPGLFTMDISWLKTRLVMIGNKHQHLCIYSSDLPLYLQTLDFHP